MPTKTATVPKEFHLTAGRKHQEEDQPEEHYEFHAQPLNKKILEGVVVSVISIIHFRAVNFVNIQLDSGLKMPKEENFMYLVL